MTLRAMWGRATGRLSRNSSSAHNSPRMPAWQVSLDTRMPSSSAAVAASRSANNCSTSLQTAGRRSGWTMSAGAVERLAFPIRPSHPRTISGPLARSPSATLVMTNPYFHSPTRSKSLPRPRRSPLPPHTDGRLHARSSIWMLSPPPLCLGSDRVLRLLLSAGVS